MRQSGCSVPDWMLSLPAPSQDAKKALKMKPIGRKDISRTNGSSADAEEKRRGRGGAGGGAGGKGGKGGRERVMGGKGGVFKKRPGAEGENVGAKKGAKTGGGKKEGGGAKEEKPQGEERKTKKQKREISMDE
ncbi:hypothetical protein JCM11641_006990 [Rhodosporidiobolus odoratus]